MLTVALLLYVVAAFIGIYICMNSSWWLVVIGLIGMAVGYLYTGIHYQLRTLRLEN